MFKRGYKDQFGPRFGVKAMLLPHLCALVFRAEKEGHVDRDGDGDGDDDDDDGDDDFQDGGHLGGQRTAKSSILAFWFKPDIWHLKESLGLFRS